MTMRSQIEPAGKYTGFSEADTAAGAEVIAEGTIELEADGLDIAMSSLNAVKLLNHNIITCQTHSKESKTEFPFSRYNPMDWIIILDSL